VDTGFVVSDHCDWQELLTSIEATGAEKVICTHGYTDIFSRYLRELGYDARTESTQYGEEENEATEENLANSN
jgi:putative mRNA 3-end processing factor